MSKPVLAMTSKSEHQGASSISFKCQILGCSTHLYFRCPNHAPISVFITLRTSATFVKPAPLDIPAPDPDAENN